MKAKNQLVVLSGILVLLATATIAATYNVQTAKAAFGKDVVSGLAQTQQLKHNLFYQRHMPEHKGQMLRLIHT